MPAVRETHGSAPRRAETADEDGWRRSYLVQLAIAVLSVTAVNAIKPTITYRALALGAGPLEVGVVVSAFSLVPALTAVAIGRWVDRAGEARFMVLGMAVMTIGGVLAAVSPNLVLLGLSQVVMGMGQIINLVTGQALLANRGPRQGREVRYGTYATMNSVGQMVGPALAAAILGDVVGTRAAIATSGNPEAIVFLVGAVATGLACGLALFIPRHVATAADIAAEASTLRGGILRTAWQVTRRPGMAAAMLVSITVISCIDILIAYLPVYGSRRDLPVELIGTLLTLRAGASLMTRVFMGRLIALLGRSRLLAVSMGISALGFAALPFAESPILLAALMIMIGLGLGLGQPMTIAWIANRSPRAERATALGVRLTGNRAALLVVPSVMGAIGGAAGVGAIFGVLAAGMASSAWVAMTTPFDELVEERERVVAARAAARAGGPAGEAEPGEPSAGPHAPAAGPGPGPGRSG
jgi:MFS family permease